MKWKAYPKYKDSGVGWSGEAPEGWKTKRLSYMVLLKSGKNITSEQIAEGGDYPVYGGNGLRGFYSDYTHNGEYILIGRQGALCGNINYARGKFWASEHAVVATPLEAFETKWLGELLYAMNLNQYSVSAAQPGLSVSMIGSLKVPVPPTREQTAISDFLDRETSRLDTLIAKKQALIGLLKEKRTAIISQTVTRGLPANVAREFGMVPHKRFKDSGIEWLEKIPEEWDCWKLTHICSKICDGTHFSPKSESSGDYMYITAKNIKEHGIDLTNITFVTNEDHGPIYSRCPVKKGDVLYIKDGATAGIATVNTLDEEFSMLSSVALLRPKTYLLESRYLAYQLNSKDLKQFVLNSLVGGAMTRFTIEIICRFRIIVPNYEEQQAIATYLDRETAKIDNLIEKVQAAIDRLQEYRTALITAAVTGKIDVRHHASKKEAA